jgi:ferredoxin
VAAHRGAADFLPLIPHTKHLHLALSPVTVFLRRAGFSRIPPLSGDEDFGLDTGKDVTRIDALQAFSCVECGRCTEHCPAYNTGKVLNPKEIVLGMRGYLKEFGPAAMKRRCWASTSPKRPPSSAPPAAPASFNVRWGSSICP